MEIYLNHIQGLIDQYKPKLEEILGEQLVDIKATSHDHLFRDEIEVTELVNNKKLELTPFELLIKYTKFKLRTASHHMSTLPFKSKIYVKDGVLDSLISITLTSNKDKIGVVHELAHLASFPYAALEKHKEKTFLPLLEGFAEFVAYEYPSIYPKDKDIQNFIKNEKQEAKKNATKRRNRDKSINPYEEGYVFWSYVLAQIGKQNWRFVFENPPKTEDEIRQPQLYLDRAVKDEASHQE